MHYQQAWKYLDDLQFFKIKLGLESMQQFMDKAGNPEKNLSFIHIAGTNGKGSVGVTLLQILQAAGYRVGFYTSPHLSSVRERFRINNEYISEEDFIRHIGHIQEILGDDQITYFECTTALALLWFAEQKVDVAIMEVGMGGRLDATNIIAPLVSIITNVSMDHEEYLGNTLEEVAREKAGIIKQNVPVVSGAQGVCLDVIEQQSSNIGAPLYVYGRDFWTIDSMPFNYHGICNTVIFTDKDKSDKVLCLDMQGLQNGLLGKHQAENGALAFATLELLSRAHFPAINRKIIHDTLPTVRWPGRLERLTIKIPFDSDNTRQATREILLDGAHNPAGVASLVDTLATLYGQRRIILVWGAMADKDLGNTLPVISCYCDRIILTSVNTERAATPEQLNNLLPDTITTRTCNDVRSALEIAWESSEENDLICIAGSLYLVGAARKILCGEIIGVRKNG